MFKTITERLPKCNLNLIQLRVHVLSSSSAISVFSLFIASGFDQLSVVLRKAYVNVNVFRFG